MNPPRLAARTLAVTFGTVAAILSVVFIVLTVDMRERVRASETEKLLVSERMFTALEARRQQEQLATVTTLAENPTLKAALDTYFTERRFAELPGEQEASLRATVTREAEKLATLTGVDALAVIDTDSTIFASAGRAREVWPAGQRVELPPAPQGTFQGVAVLPRGAFRVAGATLRLGDVDIGSLVMARNLDANYAQELSELSRAGIVITIGHQVVARTVPEDVTSDLMTSIQSGETRTLNDEEYAVRTLLASGPARIYTLTSIDAAARAATRAALVALGAIALGSFILAAFGSLWLARMLTEPIDRVSGTIATMTAARDFRRTLEVTGTSRELDALTTAFNDLMQSLQSAEADTRSAYLGAIRALAAALDARDPSTAGHSERVSVLSVLIGRELHLGHNDLEVLRLGALLHDIGKIGVSDAILRKPGPLTADEFEQIRRHPALGARILRQVPFLAPHIPIVELHHERPDGKGYPFGLRGDEIPAAARIVHVVDAFDAMTSTRAYRPPRSAAAAMAELQRWSGIQFDPDAVQALADALPSSPMGAEPAVELLLGSEVV